MESAMTDRELIALFGIVVIVLQIIFTTIQFLYHVWTKAQTEKIINASQEGLKDVTTKITKTILQGIQSFDSHVERTKLTHEWVHQIKEDFKPQQDGIPLIYRNTRIEGILEEIVKTMQMITATQKELVNLQNNVVDHIDRIEKNISLNLSKVESKIEENIKICLTQTSGIDKEISKLQDKINLKTSSG